jgi:predicted RNA-binding Zn-ribbon protein involved in translation (DUF1610 family)
MERAPALSISIRFDCPQCGATIIVPVQNAGQKLVCPFCKQELIVPKPEKAPEDGESGSKT